MIKINLLPVRAAKKKETAVQQITIFCVSLVVVLVIVGALYAVKLGQISSAKNDISAANSKINELKVRFISFPTLNWSQPDAARHAHVRTIHLSKKFKENYWRKLLN